MAPLGDRSGALLAEARQALVGGCLGRFLPPDWAQVVPAYGSGSRLVDVDGRELLDYMMGYGPLILGHSHPAVVAAVVEQAQRGSHFYFLTEQAVRLAETVRRLVPAAERVRFVSSGSDAVQAALRLARAFSGRRKILKFEGAYHGTSDFAQHSVSARPVPEYPRAWPESAGIAQSATADVLVAPFNDLETTARIVAEHAGELACVIAEPIQRTIPPRDGFLQELRRITAEHGVLLVLDEVITGFRLGLGGAQELFGVRADIACYGKILGGGYPLGAVAGRADVLDLADPRRAGRADAAVVSGTLNGNPLCCAAGLATLQVLEASRPYELLARRTARLKDGLREIGARYGLPIQTSGVGSVFQAVFADEEPTDGATLERANWARTNRFSLEMIARGFLLFRVTFLSIAHTDEDVDRTLEAADVVVRDLSLSVRRQP
ncbi:MAG: aspartate aminotransferase family protein [Chloroflexi bacterium]|nr:aspartate aminotransferase family protein [Chloroflexota bacterium]